MTPTLEELERLLAEATPGPFHYGIAYEGTEVKFSYKSPGYYDNTGIISADGTTVAGCNEYNIFHSPQDAALIVAAVNALPSLIAAARERDRLTAENDKLRKQAVDGFWVTLSSHERLKADNERLREALQSIADASLIEVSEEQRVARAALEGKP